jgi:hypothetical protein
VHQLSRSPIDWQALLSLQRRGYLGEQDFRCVPKLWCPWQEGTRDYCPARLRMDHRWRARRVTYRRRNHSEALFHKEVNE